MRPAYACLTLLPLLALGCSQEAGPTGSVETDQHLASGKSGKPAGGAPLFDDLGDHHYPITTRSEQAQRYFDQGLILTYAFNHPEAIRSFEEAARHDPRSAISWWGVALNYGPNINKLMDKADVPKAWAALE